MHVRMTTDAFDLSAAADETFDAFPGLLNALVAEGAASLREGDPYTDRTGTLRRETKAEMGEGSDGLLSSEVRVHLVMDTPYASYVKNLGYSHFDEVAAEIEEQFADGVHAIERSLGGQRAVQFSPTRRHFQRGQTSLPLAAE